MSDQDIALDACIEWLNIVGAFVDPSFGKIQELKMKHVKRNVCTAVLGAAIGMLSTAIMAEDMTQEQAEQAIKYRQNVMSALGGLTGAAVGQLRDGITYGPSLGAVAAGMQALSKDIPALFPKGSDFGETKAKAEIWSDSAGFADKASQASDAIDGFAEAVKSGDKAMIMQAFKSVGDSCKGCHEDYRAK